MRSAGENAQTRTKTASFGDKEKEKEGVRKGFRWLFYFPSNKTGAIAGRETGKALLETHARQGIFERQRAKS